MLRFGRRSKQRFISRTEEKDIRKSIEHYEQLIQQEPENVEYWNSLGDLYMRVREREKALNCYKKAFHLYADEHYIENAIGVGKKILRYDPAQSTTHLKLAELYVDDDVRNYKAALDEIQRFYQTAQRLSQEELGKVMHILTRVWEDLTKKQEEEEDFDRLPLLETLFSQTEELLQDIAISGIQEADNPLRQEDLASLEEIYGGAEAEAEAEVRADEVLEVGKGPSIMEEPGVEVQEEPETISAQIVEEEDVGGREGEVIPKIPTIEDEGEDVVPRLPEEAQPEVPSHVPKLESREEEESEEKENMGLDANMLLDVLEEGVSQARERDGGDQAEGTQVEISGDRPSPLAKQEENTQIPHPSVKEKGVKEDSLDFLYFLESQHFSFGEEGFIEEDWLEVGYSLLTLGRMWDALGAFQTALRVGKSLQALKAIAQVYAEAEMWDHVVQTVTFMERISPSSGADWKALAAGYGLRARALRHLGKQEEALKDAQRAQILGGRG